MKRQNDYIAAILFGCAFLAGLSITNMLVFYCHMDKSHGEFRLDCHPKDGNGFDGFATDIRSKPRRYQGAYIHD
jgi:hypothetical protein